LGTYKKDVETTLGYGWGSTGVRGGTESGATLIQAFGYTRGDGLLSDLAASHLTAESGLG